MAYRTNQQSNYFSEAGHSQSNGVAFPALGGPAFKQNAFMSYKDGAKQGVEDMIDFALSSKRMGKTQLLKHYESKDSSVSSHSPRPSANPKQSLASQFINSTSPTAAQILIQQQGAIVIPTKRNPNKMKRKKKNEIQSDLLEKAFKARAHWSKDDIRKLSEMTGLTKHQVYKWNWDQKKKFALELQEPSNSTEQSEVTRDKAKEEHKFGKIQKVKYEPSINSVYKVYKPTQSMSLDKRSISKLKTSGLLPTISDHTNLDTSERRQSHRFTPSITIERMNSPRFLPPLTPKLSQNVKASLNSSQTFSTDATLRSSLQSSSGHGPDVTPYLSIVKHSSSVKKQRPNNSKKTKIPLSKIELLERKLKRFNLDDNSPTHGFDSTDSGAGNFRLPESRKKSKPKQRVSKSLSGNQQEFKEFLSVDQKSQLENRNKRNTMKKERTPRKKRPADQLIQSLELELLQGKNVIEECSEDESPSNARTPVPNYPKQEGLLIQRKFSKIVEDDVLSIPDVIYETGAFEEDQASEVLDLFLYQRQRSNSLGRVSSTQTKQFLDEFCLQNQSSFTKAPKIVKSPPLQGKESPHSNIEAGYGRYQSSLGGSFNLRTKTQKSQGLMFGFGRSETISSGQFSVRIRKFAQKKGNSFLTNQDRQSSGSSWKQAFTLKNVGSGLQQCVLRKGSGSFNNEQQNLSDIHAPYLGDLSAQARIRDNESILEGRSFVLNKNSSRYLRGSPGLVKTFTPVRLNK